MEYGLRKVGQNKSSSEKPYSTGMGNSDFGLRSNNQTQQPNRYDQPSSGYNLMQQLPDYEGDESELGYIGRNAARLGARAGETFLGAPADIATGAANLGILATTPIAHALGKETEYIDPNNIPGSSPWLKENVTKRLTGEYLNPRTQGEQKSEDIWETAVALFTPLPGQKFQAAHKGVKGAQNFLKKLGISATANTAKWATEELTGSKELGAGVKMGTMMLMNLKGTRSELENARDENYKIASSKRPKDAKINVAPQLKSIESVVGDVKDRHDKDFLQDRLNAITGLVTKPERGISAKESIEFPTDKFGLPIVSGTPVLTKTPATKGTKGGLINVDDLIKLKQDWNNWMQDSKLKPETKNSLKRMIGPLNGAIETYGAKNPEFYRPWKIAEELQTGLNSQNIFQRTLSKIPGIESKIDNPVISYLVHASSGGLAHYAFDKGLGPVGLAIGTSYGASEAAKAWEFINKSPIAKKLYKDSMINALKGNAKETARDLIKLNDYANSL